MNRILEDAINALEKALPVWQPIETAPKDGKKILVLAAPGIYIAWWSDGNWEDHQRMFNGGAALKPTHWMPLPAPPEEG